MAAAVRLFAERGFDEVTVATVARDADVTTRTAYRYFVDKADLLFSDDEQVADLLARRLAEQPEGISAVESVRRALTSLTPLWNNLRDIGRLRLQVIERTPSLRARARLKLAGHEEVVARSLRARGSGELHARVVARVQVAAFDEAVRHWLLDESDRSLTATVEDILGRVDVRIGFSPRQPTGAVQV